MNQMTDTQKKVVTMIATAVYSTIKETSAGVPGGTLYAALMAHGCQLHQFEQIMAALVNSGVVTKRGELYFAA